MCGTGKHCAACNNIGEQPYLTTIDVVCAWCGIKTDEKTGDGIPGTSHTICEDCFAKYFGLKVPA